MPFAEERVADCETVDPNADETRVVRLGRFFFFGQMRNTMDEFCRGFRESMLRA